MRWPCSPMLPHLSAPRAMATLACDSRGRLPDTLTRTGRGHTRQPRSPMTARLTYAVAFVCDASDTGRPPPTHARRSKTSQIDHRGGCPGATDVACSSRARPATAHTHIAADYVSIALISRENKGGESIGFVTLCLGWSALEEEEMRET